MLILSAGRSPRSPGFPTPLQSGTPRGTLSMQGPSRACVVFSVFLVPNMGWFPELTPVRSQTIEPWFATLEAGNITLLLEWTPTFTRELRGKEGGRSCNAPTGVKGQTLAKRVQLLDKSTGSYGKPSDEVSLVLRWTSKLGRCLTRQSKRRCSEATTEKAISDKPSTGLRTRGSTKEQRVKMKGGERGSLRRGCDTLT